MYAYYELKFNLPVRGEVYIRAYIYFIDALTLWDGISGRNYDIQQQILDKCILHPLGYLTIDDNPSI